MDANGGQHQNQHGMPHGGFRASAGNKGEHKKAKVLTVYEALPYSPFSSVIPFNSDVIPLPSIGLRSNPIFSTPADRDQIRQGLESLNIEIQQNPQDTSQKLQKSLQDLKELLKPEGIPQFDFKVGPKNHVNSGANEDIRVSLSPFARRVLDQTNLRFSYPPLVKKPLSTSKVGEQQKRRNPSKSAPKSTHPSMTNSQVYNSNTTVEVQLPRSQKGSFSTPPHASLARQRSNFAIEIPELPKSFPREQYLPSKVPVVETPLSTSQSHSHPQPNHHFQEEQRQPQPKTLLPTQPHQPDFDRQSSHQSTHLSPSRSSDSNISLSSSNATLAVVIPGLPPTFRQEDYEVLPDSPDTLTHLSRKRARAEIDEDDDQLSRSVDQREKADAAFRNLRDYLQELFEAEDQLQPDSLQVNRLFVSTSEGASLSTEAHSKAESLLQKVISLGRFLQAPLEDLLHLQRLCEGAMKVSENIDVKIDDTMSTSEIDSWLQQITIAELGVKAARTSLRLMAGGREENQIYSEDVIQSALNAFKNVTENCIIPIVEMRSTGSSAVVFKLLSAEKKPIASLLTQCRRLFSIMANLIGSIELSETVINTLEFMASKLVFVENAHTERDSILGVSKFDSLRVVAMDVLAQIFLSHPGQRQGIFDEILTSLEKLPVTKQSARQFKLAEGGSIQLVSALVMRLIQTSASKLDEAKEQRRVKALEVLDDDINGENPEHKAVSTSTRRLTITTETRGEQQPVTAIQELKDVVSPLADTALQNASYVVRFIVTRAMNSTKSGDAPYRNLLDLFVQDFITCLNSTDWPAAELLLRLFLIKMVRLAEGEKTPAPDKNMALDLLGLMGAAISELNSHVRKTAASLENGESDLGKYLSSLAEASLEKKAAAADIVSWPCGPFRTSLEYLQARSSSEPHLTSAIGFFEAEWALKICSSFDLISDEDEDHLKVEKEHGRLAYRLRMMVTDPRWLSTEYTFEVVSPAHARLAYSLTLLNSQFCESFGRVLMILLGSMQSEQATVRSKSLKSVNQVLDTDPTIIDREPAVLHLIGRCANDQSVQVRDSALQLIGKCINLRPALEEDMLASILQRVNDSGVMVRKRAIKLAKDIYLRNLNRDARSLIADALLHRVNDLDEVVRELAQQTIEEIWMSPFYQTSSTDINSAPYKLAMAEHVALMVKTVHRGNGVAIVLDKVLHNVLSPSAKLSAANLKVCKTLVATMFETIIDNRAGAGNEAPSARDAMEILKIFAKSNPQLFTTDQIQLLLPYISNVAMSDDLVIYRSVVIIFRHVLPHFSKAQHSFLISVRKELCSAGIRMTKIILDDVMACLWIISTVLDDFQLITRMATSTLQSLQNMQSIGPNPADGIVKKLNRQLLFVGMCGKHFDLDPQLPQFQQKFAKFKSTSVSQLMCDTFAPFASPSQIMDTRSAALDAIGMVCQAWPKNFASPNISNLFKEVFSSRNSALETIVMKAFKDFLLLEEKRSEAGHEGIPGATADPTGTLSVMGGGQGDGAAPTLAQTFLKPITRIALSEQNDQALLATELLASISRQGLCHPKEPGLPLIALETSENSKISEIAFREHRAMHEKHETTLEKDYMRAVHLAYQFQSDIYNSSHGATLEPYTSKLHMMVDVLKVSKPKNRKRFFENLCSKIEFDLASMDTLEKLGRHLQFAQFIVENLAFFEYVTIDELLAVINSMEKVVAATGTGIAHAIETEILKMGLDQSFEHPVQPDFSQLRLQQLAASSMMLSSLWGARTHLRRQYGLMNNKQNSKGKAGTKDLNKAPVKLPGVNGDRFWEETNLTMAALESEESMLNQCKAFVELLTVDQDFKVVAEGDEEAERVRPSTPSDGEDNSGPATPGPSGGSIRGQKRKANSATPSGRKKRARSSSVSHGRGRPKVHGKRASIEKSDDGSDGGF